MLLTNLWGINLIILKLDPVTKSQLEWNEGKKEWTSRQSDVPHGNPDDYELVDDTYMYTDKTTGNLFMF